MNTPIVSVDWLHKHIDDPNLIILDASLKLSPTEYKNNSDKIRIPGARYFNIKETFSDVSSDLPNMLIDERGFQENCRRLGISNESNIVVYDCVGIYTSPRVWWMFNTMGHKNIAVLDGGMPAWISKGLLTESIQLEDYKEGNFEAELNSLAIRDMDFVKENIDNKASLIIDARSRGRFEGTAPEPRKGLRSGCIPNSINIPYTELLDDGAFKSKAALTDEFSKHDLSQRAITFSCGSGITACIVLLAARLVFDDKEFSVYDGSWTEWASKN